MELSSRFKVYCLRGCGGGGNFNKDLPSLQICSNESVKERGNTLKIISVMIWCKISGAKLIFQSCSQSSKDFSAKVLSFAQQNKSNFINFPRETLNRLGELIIVTPARVGLRVTRTDSEISGISKCFVFFFYVKRLMPSPSVNSFNWKFTKKKMHSKFQTDFFKFLPRAL